MTTKEKKLLPIDSTWRWRSEGKLKLPKILNLCTKEDVQTNYLSSFTWISSIKLGEILHSQLIEKNASELSLQIVTN